jgi:hypothetical protein
MYPIRDVTPVRRSANTIVDLGLGDIGVITASSCGEVLVGTTTAADGHGGRRIEPLLAAAARQS